MNHGDDSLMSKRVLPDIETGVFGIKFLDAASHNINIGMVVKICGLLLEALGSGAVIAIHAGYIVSRGCLDGFVERVSESHVDRVADEGQDLAELAFPMGYDVL